MTDDASWARSKPRLQTGFRLQWEEAQGRNVLLFPEGMVQLNGAASEILGRCTGTVSIAQIIAELEQAFPGANVSADVVHFLHHALDRQWLTLTP
jgi:pyrroloquinoline quinone biosynthesis protein D